MDELTKKLADGDHPVEFTLRPNPTLDGMKACIERGYVHVRFTETRGGTELGFAIDHSLSDFSGADWDTRSGSVRLCGSLTLNYEKVRCVADISLETMKGTGRLEVVA